MYQHSDPTADRAVGAADREWRTMARKAYRCRTDPRTADNLPELQRIFTGIFSRLLTEPLERLREMCGYPDRKP